MKVANQRQKRFGYKLQDMNELIIHNNLRNERQKEITYTIQGFDLPLIGNLDNGTFMNYKPLSLLYKI